MGLAESLVALTIGVGLVGMATVLVHLSRSRARVMGYHDIRTPEVNESTHGGGPAD